MGYYNFAFHLGDNFDMIVVRLPNQKNNSFVKMLLLLPPPPSLPCVWSKTSRTNKKKKKPTAKLLIFKCTQCLTWVECRLSLQNYGWLWLQTLNDVKTQNHYAIRVKVVQQFVFIIIIVVSFWGRGLYYIHLKSNEKDNGSWSWVLICNPMSSRRERESGWEDKRRLSKVSLFWNRAWL